MVLTVCSAGCLGDDPVTDTEVIAAFGPVGEPGAWIADGHSPIEIEICTTGEAGLDPTMKATIGPVSKSLAFTLSNAPIARVRLARDGQLSDTEASMLMITATLDVA